MQKLDAERLAAGHFEDLGRTGGCLRDREIRKAPPGRIVQLEILAEMAEKGANLKQIRAKSEELGWGLSDNVLLKLYRLAERLACRRMSYRWRGKKDGACLRLDAMFREAVEAGDLKMRLQIQQELNKLNGAYPEKHQTIDVNQKSEVTVVNANKLFEQIKTYEDEFRLAAKAERMERQLVVVTGEDRTDAGMHLPLKERNRGQANVEPPDENHSDEPVLEDLPDEPAD